MTVTLYLREGMKWSDGKPFVADDFLFYWNDIGLNEELFPTPPSQMRFAGKAGTISKVSDTSVQISWDVPAVMFVEFMARWRPANYAHSEFLRAFHPAYTKMETIEASMKENGFETWTDQFKQIYNPEQSPKTPVIGPWKLENEKTDQVLVLNRNPYYWKVDTAGNQLPYIDAIHSQGAPTGEAELLKILAGESDLQAPGTWGRHRQPGGGQRAHHSGRLSSHPVLVAGRRAGADPVQLRAPGSGDEGAAERQAVPHRALARDRPR